MTRHPRTLIDVEELAPILQVEPKTLYGWVSAKKVPHFKVGRLVRFDLETVLEWFRQTVVAAPSQKESAHDSDQEARQLAHSVSIQRPSDGRTEKISPYDWGHNHKGRST